MENISAKLSAQIDTGARWFARTSAPAAMSRPAMVSMRGRPAAIRLPKAMTRMAGVTGQESTSERIMAARLAELKSAHGALSPVRARLTSRVLWRDSGLASWPAAATMALVPAAAPAVTTAVRPSGEIDEPGREGTTTVMSGFARSVAATRAMTAWASGSWTIRWLRSTTTTCRALDPRWEKSLRMICLAWTDWLVESCQPAPASTDSTFGP